MKTLAELKREANAQAISVEMIYRYGKEIPERLKGIRKATRANTVGVFFRNARGEESELHITSANLIDYDGDAITVYQPGTRELTSEEQNALDKATEAQREYEKKYPYCESWFVKGAYIKNHYPQFDYLTSHERKRGKYYYMHNNTISDNAIKGEAIIKYKVYHN